MVARRLAVPLAAVLLAGCGGGSVWLGYTWTDGDPPWVALFADAASVPPGGTVRLVADTRGPVDRVYFYRLDGDTPVRIGRDDAPPFETVLTEPADGRASVRAFAEAVDRDGWVGESDVLDLPVR